MTQPAFLITHSPRLPGVRLSMPGQWGNMPFPDAPAAEAEARRIGGRDVAIETRRVR
ncbi:hypothetical protein [Sphingomonas sp.]|uniref:hypothetical protein n=1 Tax=Sphingomonas sp. TaxID=28214 RepID=UPI0035A82554